jgi:hypothetical protein
MLERKEEADGHQNTCREEIERLLRAEIVGRIGCHASSRT